MRVGLVDVDGHNFPNFALMKISAWHKMRGDDVEWHDPFGGHYDKVYMSKVFTFSPDYNYCIDADVIEKGGTGYDIKKKLPEEIEECRELDYSIYPQYPFSVQFFSRGCIRHCPFCLVRDKEGKIQPKTPHALNPNGEWIEVLDNNFFANPNWREAVAYLKEQKKSVKFHGVDVRLMTEEMAEALNSLKLKGGGPYRLGLAAVRSATSNRSPAKAHKAKKDCMLRSGRFQLHEGARPFQAANSKGVQDPSLCSGLPRFREQENSIAVREGHQQVGKPYVDIQHTGLFGLRTEKRFQMQRVFQ